MATPRLGPEAILRFAQLLWQPGDVCEVRAIHPTGGWISAGYFDSPETLAREAAKLDGRQNLFITLNPVDPNLLARAQNHIEERLRDTTSDENVLRIRWLFIDVDPRRPSGISSTEAERDRAQEVLETLSTHLSGSGWPFPVQAMSGNGYYALYRIDLPRTIESTSLVRAVLRELDQQFSTDAAHIDTTVHNPSRIAGLLGTLKMKGDSTETRPHRRSALLSVPDSIEVVSEEQLRALVPSEERTASLQSTVRPSAAPPLTDLLDAAGIAYREQPPDANAITWFHVQRCPFHADGKDYECGVGQKLPAGAYAGHGFHPECADKGWQEWKLALGLAVGSRHLRSITQPLANRRPTDFPLTDAGNAELFAHLFADQLRYDFRRNRWYWWDEHRWREDLDSSITQKAIDAVRQRYLATLALDDPDEKTRQAKFAIQSENRQRLEALLALAKTRPPIADRGDSWDQNPWLLGVANGVINLKTGALQPGMPGQKITRLTDIDFDPDAACPRWLQFLDEVFGDTETIGFIQKAVGYSLSGDTSEQCVFLCHGQGSNGKSVFLTVLRALTGGYAYNAPFSILELHNKASIPNDVAAIASARLVTASETNDGTLINAARLKALSGEDPMTARFLHGEFFTFEPLAKLWLAVNHLPIVSDQSHGFWRRLRTIRFGRTFEGDEDKRLVHKLRRELPGILTWALQGCLTWQYEGLGLPEAVEAATETYRQDSDPLAGFIDERCVQNPAARCGANEAYLSYVVWANDRALRERERLSSKGFGTRMTERFPKKRSGSGNVYVGIGLRSERLSSPPDPAQVQDQVQGRESDEGSNLVFSPSESLTQKNQGLPCTTLHPTQSDTDLCLLCSEPTWFFAPDGTPLCEQHSSAQEGALT